MHQQKKGHQKLSLTEPSSEVHYINPKPAGFLTLGPLLKYPIHSDRIAQDFHLIPFYPRRAPI